jgi:hypothetical protein
MREVSGMARFSDCSASIPGRLRLLCTTGSQQCRLREQETPSFCRKTLDNETFMGFGDLGHGSIVSLTFQKTANKGPYPSRADH